MNVVKSLTALMFWRDYSTSGVANLALLWPYRLSVCAAIGAVIALLLAISAGWCTVRRFLNTIEWRQSGCTYEATP